MNIVYIDNDFQEGVFVRKGLQNAFPESTISIFTNVGTFLEEYSKLPKPFILVLEIILPLFAVQNGDDELIRRTENLKSQFPWLGDDWDRLYGGEVLIRGIWSIQSDQPIVVYTDFDYGQISEDIRKMSNLKICEKGDDGNFPNLVRKIQSFRIV